MTAYRVWRLGVDLLFAGSGVVSSKRGRCGCRARSSRFSHVAAAKGKPTHLTRCWQSAVSSCGVGQVGNSWSLAILHVCSLGIWITRYM
ncbi:hypothetical protein Pelo_17351 [Pelomyxa schiedti]|nr:hypothetical protein Pelo_17351 [Pelomyxa schiedti]